MRDIRELKDDPEAYRDELQRRWSGLLSYRYIGRNHSSMNLGPEDNTVKILDPGFDVQTIEVVDSGSIHQGRTMGYGRCRIVDAANHDRVIALIDGQGASIGTPPEGLERMDVEEAKLEIEDSPDLPPLWQVFGASRRDDGHWTLPELSVEFASPDAALHIGPQHIVLETAAVDLAA